MLVKWCIGLPARGFNEGKCKVLHIGSRNQKHDYHMKAVILAVAIKEKDLGVIIVEELKFHKYLVAAIKKSSMRLGLIRGTFICLGKVTVPRLFTTWSGPILSVGTSYGHHVSRWIV